MRPAPRQRFTVVLKARPSDGISELPDSVSVASRWAAPVRAATIVGGMLLGAGAIVGAYDLARERETGPHFEVFWAGFALVLLTTLFTGLRRTAGTRVQLATLVGLGIVTFLPKLLMSAERAVYFDEFGQWRQAKDMAASGDLFVTTPFLPIKEYYPGTGALTWLLHEVSSLPIWHAGQVLVVLAHTAVLLVVYQACRQVGLDRRLCFLGAVVYALNPSYLYFDAQFSYESVGLPMAFAAFVLAFSARRADSTRRAFLLCAAALVLGVATVVTHHTSAALLVALLAVTALLTPAVIGAPRRVPRWGPVLVLVATGAAFFLWTTEVADSTLDYVAPHVASGISDALNLATGGGEQARGRTPFTGTTLPGYEIVCAFLAPLIAAAAVGAGVLRMRMAEWRQKVRLLAPFLLLAAVYFASMPLALTVRGSETAHRIWGYGYVGVAVLAAMGAPVLWSAARRLPARGRPLLAFLLVMVVAVGNVAAGSNVFYRFPGPAVFGTDSRSQTPELRELANWLDSSLDPGSRVVTDRFTGLAVIGYTRLLVPTPEDSLVYRIYREGPEPTEDLRRYLRDNDFEYFILDRRIEDELPRQKLFQGYAGPLSVSPAALRDIARTSFLTEIHRTPTYSVLRIHA